MPTLKIEFPIWVQYVEKSFIVRPLLFDGATASGGRYERALKDLGKEIRRQFAKHKTNRSNLNHLLWYLFNPEINLDTLELSFSYGQRYFNGKISVARFEFKAYTVVCLPAFEQYYFISSEKYLSKQVLAEEVIFHIQQFVREKRKELAEEIRLEDYASTKNEFYATFDLSLFVSHEKISLNGQDDDFFKEFFRQDSNFDGRIEANRVGYSLNDLHPSELSRAYYQDDLVAQLFRLIYNRENAPIVILAPKGAGKTTLIHEVVHRYIEQNAAQSFHRLDDIWEIDPSRVISGMSIIGMWQRRMESIISYLMQPLEDFPRQDKLYLSNVVSLFRIGKSAQNNMTLSDVLKPYLQKRQLQLILEATPAEWDIACEMDRGFTDLFKVIRIEVPNPITTLRIIGRIRLRLEQEKRFSIHEYALFDLIELHQRFGKNEVLLGLVAEHLEQLAARYTGRTVGRHEINAEFNNKTHLNSSITNSREQLTTQDFYNYITQKLVGQDHAVQCLSDTLSLIKAQLNDPNRPFGSFLFIGPTGVGKTQAAKVLAEYLFTHEESLVRFDMNEFIDSQAVSRLVGDFYNPEGLLSAKMRYNPYCVLLFDEIEKAHPDVHNLLLQVLDEGRLTDALGRTITLCNTVIIMTSNLGAERVGREINILRSEQTQLDTYQKAIRDFFKPEFINRIDKIIIFNKLQADHIAKIAWLQIKDLLKRHGFVRRHTILNVSENVLQRVARSGFDPEMGGRALKRQIEKELTVLVAEQLSQVLPDKPVVFNLYLHKQQIKPHLVVLEHIEAKYTLSLPMLSDVPSVEDFDAMLQEVLLLKTSLRESPFIKNTEEIGVNAALESLKERINLLEEKIRNIIYEYELNANLDFSGTLYTVSTANAKIISHKSSKVEKTLLRDIYSKLQISEYLEEVYQAGERITKESQHLYLELYKEIKWCNYFYQAHQQNGIEQVWVELQSKVTNQGKEQIEHIIKLYELLDFEMQPFEVNSTHYFVHLRGIGIKKLLEGEEGYHMFLRRHEAPLPIEIKTHTSSSKDVPEQQLQQLIQKSKKILVLGEEEEENAIISQRVAYIIRIYDLAQGKKNIYTDLSTGLINKGTLNEKDVQMWCYMRCVE